jgi:Tol biopolymer transport system component
MSPRLPRFAMALALLPGLAVADAAAEDAPGRTRRILYNIDGDSCIWTRANAKGPVATTVEDLKSVVDEVTGEGSQVDTVLVCVGAQVTYYPSQVGTLRGTRSTPEERARWRPHEVQRFENIKRFFDAGVDPYAVMLRRAKERGREALVSFRVNDAHGNDFLRTRFWEDHHDCRLPKGALDFARDEARDYVFRLIDEAITRYDCDGLELDFNRFPAFFKPGELTTEQRVAKINDLVGRVRARLDALGRERGRKERLILAARVPSNFGRTPPTPKSSREAGCDLAAWVRNGWVDFVTVSDFYLEKYNLPIREWKEAIRGVSLYGGIECTEGPGREHWLTAAKYRRAARRLWDEGADGIYLFNFFTTREHYENSWEPPFEVLRELGDPARLRASDRSETGADGPDELVFSVLRFEGEYTSRDIPGGVESTPTVGAILTVRDDGSNLSELTRAGRADYPIYARDGRSVYFQSRASGQGKVYRCGLDGGGLAVVASADRLGPMWKDAYGILLSADGTKLVYVVNDGATGRVVVADADGANPRLVAPELGYLYMSALTPDNAYAILSGPASGYRLVRVRLSDGASKTLTPDHPECFGQQVTPDGKTVVFVRRDGDVYRVGLDGDGLRRLTHGNHYVTFHLSPKDAHGSTDAPQISPDGRRVAYIAVKDGVPNVCVMNFDGTGQTRVTHRTTPCGRVRWSPDGRKLAFVSWAGKTPQLFVVPADGGEPRQITRLDGTVNFVQWRPRRAG